MAHTEKKKIQCITCGYETLKSYNFDKRGWVRPNFKCPKCKMIRSFQWYNF